MARLPLAVKHVFTTRRGWVCALAGVALPWTAGCGSVGAEGSLSAAQVRFVEISPGAPAMDFYVDGAGAAYNIGFANFTSYLPVTPGVSSLHVSRAGSGQVLATAQGALSGGRQYTVVVSHGLGNLQERVYQDQDTPAPAGQMALRVLNGLEGVGSVSVYVMAAGGPGSGPPVSVFSVGNGAASGYANLPANGSYAITATIAEGALNVPVASVTLKAASGAVRTVVFAGVAQAGGRGAAGFSLQDVDVPQ